MWAADLPPVAPIYGHRCLPGDGTENTLEALRRVDDLMQEPACEIDTWRLADGRWVVVHDPTWKRTIDPATIPAGTPATVKDTTYDQVREMRTKDGLKVPTLSKFLNVAERRGVRLLVELKNYTPDRLLASHPDVWAYRQVQPTACNPQPLSDMVAAGHPTGYKEGPCEFTVQQVVDMGVGLAAYRTAELLADDNAIGKELVANGIHPVTVMTPRPYRQRLAYATGASLIVPHPKAAEDRLLP